MGLVLGVIDQTIDAGILRDKRAGIISKIRG